MCFLGIPGSSPYLFLSRRHRSWLSLSHFSAFCQLELSPRKECLLSAQRGFPRLRVPWRPPVLELFRLRLFEPLWGFVRRPWLFRRSPGRVRFFRLRFRFPRLVGLVARAVLEPQGNGFAFHVLDPRSGKWEKPRQIRRRGRDGRPPFRTLRL